MKCRYCDHVVKDTFKSGYWRREQTVLNEMRNHIWSQHLEQIEAINTGLQRALGDMRFLERQMRIKGKS